MKKKNTRICSNCLDDFPTNKIFKALVPNRDYYTCYCEECIKILGIVECESYVKPRKPKNSKL